MSHHIKMTTSKQSKKRDELLKKSYKTSIIPSEILNIMNIGKYDFKIGGSRHLKSKYVKNYVHLDEEHQQNPLEKSETMTTT